MIAQPPDRFIGLMSGTSQDAIDGVLATFPDALQPQTLATFSLPLPNTLRRRLDALQTVGGGHLDEALALHQELGERFADCALELLRCAGIEAKSVRAIGSHGQTVRHNPHGPAPYSLQLGNAALIASRTGIPTVADFRSGDMASGGQGAPLAPAFHQAVLSDSRQRRAVLNLGGMANLTLLGTPTRGWDVGPGNVLLDAWIARHRGVAFDADGQWARSGRVDHSLLAALLAHPFIERAAPKSTGREDFNLTWLDTVLDRFPTVDDVDIQATLAEFTAASVSGALKDELPLDELLICGGGVRNSDLVDRIARRLSEVAVASTQSAGVDPQWVEALTFAWLAKQRVDEKPLNLQSITGSRRAVIPGCVYLP